MNKFPEQPPAFPSTSGDIFEDQPLARVQGGEQTPMTPEAASQQPFNTSEAHPAVATDSPNRMASPPMEAQSAADDSHHRQQHELAKQRAAAIAALQPGQSVAVHIPGRGNVIYRRDPQNDKYGRAVYTSAAPARPAPDQLPPRPQSQPIAPNALPAPYEGPYPGPQGMVDFGPQGTTYEEPPRPTVSVPWMGNQPPEVHPDAGPDFEPAGPEGVFSDPLRRHRRTRYTEGEGPRPSEQPPEVARAESPPEKEQDVIITTRDIAAVNPYPTSGQEGEHDNSEDPTIILTPAEMAGGDDMTVLERAARSEPKTNTDKGAASTETTAPAVPAGAAAAAEHARKTALPEEAPGIQGVNPDVVTSEMQAPDLDLDTPRLPYRRNNT